MENNSNIFLMRSEGIYFEMSKKSYYIHENSFLYHPQQKIYKHSFIRIDFRMILAFDFYIIFSAKRSRFNPKKSDISTTKIKTVLGFFFKEPVR